MRSNNSSSEIIIIIYELLVKVSSLFLYQKVKPPSEDQWHMRSGVHFLFLKQNNKKRKNKPNTSYLHIFHLKISQYD